jgi:hypothetical protein
MGILPEWKFLDKQQKPDHINTLTPFKPGFLFSFAVIWSYNLRAFRDIFGDVK